MTRSTRTTTTTRRRTERRTTRTVRRTTVTERRTRSRSRIRIRNFPGVGTGAKISKMGGSGNPVHRHTKFKEKVRIEKEIIS